MPARIRAYVRQHHLALLALFVALGGTSYAATRIPANSVGNRQIKNNAVTSPKIKDQSLLAKDFKSGQLPRGPKGDTGPSTGPASGDLAGNYPAPTIRPAAVTAAKLAPEGTPTPIGFPSGASCSNGGTYCGYIVVTGPTSIRSDIWDNYGGGFAPGTYRRDARNVVHLSGLAVGHQTADCGQSGSAIFYLPAGDRPAAKHVFPAIATNSTAARIDVQPDGKVTCVTGNATGYLSLEGISFLAG